MIPDYNFKFKTAQSLANTIKVYKGKKTPVVRKAA